MSRPSFRLVALLLGLFFVGHAGAQSLTVTFRYLDPGKTAVRAFVPGSFNGWGQPYTPGTPSCIGAGHASAMTYDADGGFWHHTVTLQAGQAYQYKIQVHHNEAGTECTWFSDPLNPVTVGANNDSEVVIADPMVFQPAGEVNADGLMTAVSAGVFGSQAFAQITFTVNGIERTDGLDFYDPATGLFRFVLDVPVRAGSQFTITATDIVGRSVSAEIGELFSPIEWETEPFTTVKERFPVRAFLTRFDGTVDPALTEATLRINGAVWGTVAVTDGVAEAEVDLELGANELVLEAVIDGQPVTSAPLVLTRRRHPLDAALATAAVSGADRTFQIDLTPTALATAGLTATWQVDEQLSTTGLEGPLNVSADGLSATGTVTGPGELYVDVALSDPEADDDALRVAVLVDADGTARAMRYEENAAWVKNAVVYEVFPLMFGPEGSGTVTNPGNKFNEIREELDYIAAMGFNAIWFMPIMHNQFMDGLSGGYNIIDFYNVDPKLGTNDDFRALVERAHELGLRIILDLTPNHVSPVHPWVESLRQEGAFSSFIQTTPSNHDRGLDGRGPNLPEIWHVEGGRNLYRKYDGFGDLANLNWDDDDLQAALLDVIAYWVREFDIDGWRFDVYWGPWRRYGPERFGRPIRELMKRLRPDAWLLGEIAGTGFGTEVYYADDDNGTPVVGGIDAGYDWNFYFNGIRGTYGVLSTYDALAHNGDFYPGPNARFFRFLENHDEPRIAKLFAGTPDRILPLTGFLLTTTGVPMVYHGQEVGFGNVSGDERRAPVSWETPENGRFGRYYQRLIHARRQFAAFGTQELVTLNTTNSVYAYVRPYEDANAVVAINFFGTPRTITLDPSQAVRMSHDGPVPYYDIFADTMAATTGAFTATIPPYETVVYITSEDPGFTVPDLPPLPFGAVYVGAEAETGRVPDAFRLEPAYPNPFARTTTIRYALPEPGPVRLEVYDVLGRRVATLVDQRQPAGTHAVRFDAAGLPSGTYLYRLQAGGRIATRTLVLVR